MRDLHLLAMDVHSLPLLEDRVTLVETHTRTAPLPSKVIRLRVEVQRDSLEWLLRRPRTHEFFADDEQEGVWHEKSDKADTRVTPGSRSDRILQSALNQARIQDND